MVCVLSLQREMVIPMVDQYFRNLLNTYKQLSTIETLPLGASRVKITHLRSTRNVVAGDGLLLLRCGWGRHGVQASRRWHRRRLLSRTIEAAVEGVVAYALLGRAGGRAGNSVRTRSKLGVCAGKTIDIEKFATAANPILIPNRPKAKCSYPGQRFDIRSREQGIYSSCAYECHVDDHFGGELTMQLILFINEKSDYRFCDGT